MSHPRSRLSLACMVRDEIDIMPGFLEHHLPIFDEIVVVDHRSTDGTREFLLECEQELGRARLTVITYDQVAYRQSEVSTALARSAFTNGADWVFVLDADEFIDVPSRDDLEETLRASATSTAWFRWCNILPIQPNRLNHGFLATDEPQEFITLSADEPSDQGKVAISRHYCTQYPEFTFSIGNHAVDPAPAGGAPAMGRILHIPARTVPQAMRKRRNHIESFERQLGSGYGGDSVYREQLQLLGAVADGVDASAREALEEVVLWYESRAFRDLDRTAWSVAPVAMPVRTPSAAVRSAFGRISQGQPAARVTMSVPKRPQSARRDLWPREAVIHPDRSLSIRRVRSWHALRHGGSEVRRSVRAWIASKTRSLLFRAR